MRRQRALASIAFVSWRPSLAQRASAWTFVFFHYPLRFLFFLISPGCFISFPLFLFPAFQQLHSGLCAGATCPCIAFRLFNIDSGVSVSLDSDAHMRRNFPSDQRINWTMHIASIPPLSCLRSAGAIFAIVPPMRH